jgi:hypothetical protein
MTAGVVASGLICVLACVASVCSAASTNAPPAQSSTAKSSATKPSSKKASPYVSRNIPESARQFYASTWGVDQMSVKLTESDQLVRFTYRVIDAAKAAPLNEKASSPALLDEQANVSLQVPTMEKVGPLRQSMRAENGKFYWMVFSNKGNFVKVGHRVSIVIGPFRADGLAVQK